MKRNIKQLIVLMVSATIIFVAFNACTKSIPAPFEPQADQLNLKGKTASLSDPAKLQQWLNQIGYTYTGSDCINPLTGTGPYDPTACLKKQLDELLFLKAKAKDNKEIFKILNTATTELNGILNNWSALTVKDKQKRLDMMAGSKKAILANGNNFQKGIEAFISQSRDEESIAIARSILGEPKNNCYIFGCICFTAENCPCCDFFTWLKKILGTPPPIKM